MASLISISSWQLLKENQPFQEECTEIGILVAWMDPSIVIQESFILLY